MNTPWFNIMLRNYMHKNIYTCIKAIRRYNDVHYSFSSVFHYPQEVGSFESLSFLFTSSQANYGLCLLAFDEAAYLYQVVRTIGNGHFAEIGRFKGGSTFLIAAAMDNDSILDSFDIHLITSLYNGYLEKINVDGNILDNELRNALARYGLESKVNLFVENSTTVKLPDESYDFVFIDGDHSYDGAKKDFLHWKNTIKKKGHVLFHDAAKTTFSSYSEGLIRLIDEIKKHYANQFELVNEVGSLVHFRKMR